MKYLLIGLLLIPGISLARSPEASELRHYILNTTQTTPTTYVIRATSSNPFFTTSFWTYGATGYGFLRCDGQFFASTGEGQNASYDTPLRCPGSIEVRYNNGNLSQLSLSLNGFEMSDADFDEQPTAGGGGSSEEADPIMQAETYATILFIFSISFVLYTTIFLIRKLRK